MRRPGNRRYWRAFSIVLAEIYGGGIIRAGKKSRMEMELLISKLFAKCNNLKNNCR
jgi:hypothetical protein